MIELTGEYEFSAPREMVWEMSLDPEVLAGIMPGCKQLERVGENKYKGKMNIRVGPVQGVFQGTVTLSDLQSPCRYHLVIDGRGAAGIVHGEGDVQLDATESGTVLNYTGTAKVSGRIATVGQRLMTSSAKSITRQSLENLDQQVQVRLGPPEPEVEPETAVAAPERQPTLPTPPDQTEFMLNVAKDVYEDLIPNQKHRHLLNGLALFIFITGFLNWYANLIARRVAKNLHEEKTE